MNEIIKFRVWDKFSQKFLLPTDFQINGNGILFIKNGFINGCQQDWTYGNKDSHIIQQFTGLLDKNGKGIYEGDIVLYSWGTMYQGNSSERDKGLVVITKYRIEIKTDKDGNLPFDNDFRNKKSNFEDEEIIGNIFENPMFLYNK